MPFTCPKCERVLKNINAWHYCSNQNIDNLFLGKPQILSYLLDKLLAHVIEWDNVHISATKNCIVFVASQTFLVVKPMKTALNIKFYLATPHHVAPIYKTELYGKHYEHHIRVMDLEDVNAQLIKFIQTSYKLLLAT